MSSPMRWMTQPGSQTGKTQQEYKQAWDALGKTNQELYGSKPNANQWQGYYTGGSGRQPSAYSAYSPGMAQPQQSPYANATPYGQNGNLAYAPPDQRPPPFQQSWGNPFGAATSEPNFDWRNSLIGNVNSQLGQMQQQSWQQPGVLGAPQFNFNPMAQPPGMAQPIQDPYAASSSYGDVFATGHGYRSDDKRVQPRYPAHWYENAPTIGTHDIVPLPGGGQGSSTTASWIKKNMELDRQRGLPDWPPGQDETPQLYKDQPPGARPPVDPTAPVTEPLPPARPSPSPFQDPFSKYRAEPPPWFVEPLPPGRPSPSPFQDLFSQYNFTPPPGFMDDLIRRLQGGSQPGSLGPLPNAQPGFRPPETSQPPSEPTGPASGSYEEYLQQSTTGRYTGPAASYLGRLRGIQQANNYTGVDAQGRWVPGDALEPLSREEWQAAQEMSPAEQSRHLRAMESWGAADRERKIQESKNQRYQASVNDIQGERYAIETDASLPPVIRRRRLQRLDEKLKRLREDTYGREPTQAGRPADNGIPELPPKPPGGTALYDWNKLRRQRNLALRGRADAYNASQQFRRMEQMYPGMLAARNALGPQVI